MIADDDTEDNVLLLAHAKLTAQDSVLSELGNSLPNDDSTSPNDIAIKEVINEEEEEDDEEEQPQKPPELSRIQADSGENMELHENNIKGGKEKKVVGETETNVDDSKPLSPVERQLSKQEFNKSDLERPTVKRNRFTTQRDPFHKDRAPRKSVLKRTAHPPSPVSTYEVTTPTSSPTGNDEDNDESNQHPPMDRKCCVVM